MNFNFLIFGEYNLFIWPAFIFTFLSCLALYLKTFKKFKKQEKLYISKFGQVQNTKNNISHAKEGLLNRPVF